MQKIYPDLLGNTKYLKGDFSKSFQEFLCKWILESLLYKEVLPHFMLPKGCNCAEGMKTGRYQWVSTRFTSEVPIWFYESREQKLLSISGTTSVPKPRWNTTKMWQRDFSCLKGKLPWIGICWRAHGKEYSVFLPQGRSLGNNRPFARQKMQRSCHTPNMQKWKRRNITLITANQHHLIQLKQQ